MADSQCGCQPCGIIIAKMGGSIHNVQAFFGDIPERELDGIYDGIHCSPCLGLLHKPDKKYLGQKTSGQSGNLHDSIIRHPGQRYPCSCPKPRNFTPRLVGKCCIRPLPCHVLPMCCGLFPLRKKYAGGGPGFQLPANHIHLVIGLDAGGLILRCPVIAGRITGGSRDHVWSKLVFLLRRRR